MASKFFKIAFIIFLIIDIQMFEGVIWFSSIWQFIFFMINKFQCNIVNYPYEFCCAQSIGFFE